MHLANTECISHIRDADLGTHISGSTHIRGSRPTCVGGLDQLYSVLDELRSATIARHTVSVGPFVPLEERADEW